LNIIRTIPLHRAWLGKKDCQECPIRQSALFGVLKASDLERIGQPIEHVALEPHTLLYRSGEYRGMLFTLRSGIIKLMRYLPDGNQRIVRLMGGNDLLGLEALVDQPYQHDAIALGRTEVCVIPVALVGHLSRTQPKLCEELMKRWQRTLNLADFWLTQYSTGTSRQRVARLLLSLATPDLPGPVHLFGREDMGAILGLSTETVSRAIADLRRQKILREISPNVFEFQSQVLQRIADGEQSR
jgi:CRP-like cAMP-binding protein